jgi:hypothetical protein
MTIKPKMLQQTRPSRRHERRAHRRLSLNPRTAQPQPLALVPAQQAPAEPTIPVVVCDPAVVRVQEAGGPMDVACYSCECGYYFAAPVSTTVNCPHCGSGQAW